MGSGPARTLAMAAIAAFCLLAIQATVASAAVRLNEINCEGTDWVELVNTGDASADISGWLLTDDPLNPATPRSTHRMLFPNPTVIPAHGRITVDKGTTSGAAADLGGGLPPAPPLTPATPRSTHRMLFPNPTVIPAHGRITVDKGTTSGTFPFGISCGDDTIKLADATETEADSFVVPSQAAAGDTFGRSPDMTGPFVETLPTKGFDNEPAPPVDGPPVDNAAWLFDPGKVVQIDLTLPPDSVNALAADSDTYVTGDFKLTADGTSYERANVGIRLKGGVGSFRPLTGEGQGKSAFKVKFNEFVSGQRFAGLKKLTLNNMVQD